MRDKENKKEYDRMYSIQHRDRINETKRTWLRAHPEKVKEYSNRGKGYRAQWRLDNKEKLKRYYREIWNPNNKEKLTEYRKRYLSGPGGAVNKEYNSRYHKENSDVICRRHKMARITYREQNMGWLLNYLGVGWLSCRRCGYKEHVWCIDAHHLDPSQKESKQDSLGRWIYRTPIYFIKKFLSANVVFLCKNCHYALHGGAWKIEELGGGK